MILIEYKTKERVSVSPNEDDDTPTEFAWILVVLLVPLYFIHQALAPEAESLLRVPKRELRPLWPFAVGVGCSILFAGSRGMAGLRTVFHEVRHAVVVILTANKFKRLKFYSKKEREQEGAVARCFYSCRSAAWKRLTDPLIAVAPYSFPLFTLPTLLIVYFVPFKNFEATLFAVGLAAGIDVSTAIRDFFNTNNISKGDFSSFKLGFFFGLPFCVGSNVVLIELVGIWLRRFAFGT